MKVRTLLVAASAASLLGGCAAMQPTPRSPEEVPPERRVTCPANSDAARCVITVSVPNWCWFGCTPTVDFDIVEIRGGTGAPARMMWILAGSRSFDGIEFPPDRGFTCETRPRHVVCSSTGRAPKGEYVKYTVKVRGLDPLDPWVVNN
jgi:hypothetical protein